MSVSLAQRAQYAYNAGFRNGATIEALSIIVAISQAECGVGSRTGCETGCDAGGDAPNSTCGIWQIYQPAHPGTAACASNPACCATLAWQISHQGTSFGPWSTFNSGAFRQYLPAARAAIASLNLGAPPAPPPPPPTPTPTPAPPAPPPPPGSIWPWLLAAAAVGAAWYEVEQKGLRLTSQTGPTEFGTGKLVVTKKAGQAGLQARPTEFGSRRPAALQPTTRPAAQAVKTVPPSAFGSR